MNCKWLRATDRVTGSYVQWGDKKGLYFCSLTIFCEQRPSLLLLTDLKMGNSLLLLFNILWNQISLLGRNKALQSTCSLLNNRTPKFITDSSVWGKIKEKKKMKEHVCNHTYILTTFCSLDGNLSFRKTNVREVAL